jgi:hypothetical protein
MLPYAAEPMRPRLAALRDLLHGRRAAQEGRNAERYTEALAGARAMRARAVTWTDNPTNPGADDYERRHGIPPWPAIDTE